VVRVDVTGKEKNGNIALSAAALYSTFTRGPGKGTCKNLVTENKITSRHKPEHHNTHDTSISEFVEYVPYT
jgi:hypothetical protein